MMRRRQYLLTLIAIALSILYSLPVFASVERFSLMGNASPSTEVIIAQQTPEATSADREVSLFQQLNLTREQQQKVEQIHRRYRQQIFRKKQQISRLQQQLSDMMVGTEAVDLLRAKNRELSILRQEMGLLRFESMLATREILTLQQRQKFRELVQDTSQIP